MPVARPRCCAVVTIKAPRSPQIIEGIAHARRHLCQLQIQEVPDLRMPEAMHGSSRFEHRPRPHCPQGSTVWQPLFPFSVWQSMIAADLQLALLWREASMAADQSQACTRTHAQQPHNCRFPSAPSLRKLVGKVQHTSAHRLPGVCAEFPLAGVDLPKEFARIQFTEHVPPTSAQGKLHEEDRDHGGPGPNEPAAVYDIALGKPFLLPGA